MSTTPLSILVATTYSRADLAYRIGLLREFLEFAFFSSNTTEITKDVLAAFEEKGHAVADIEFLRTLPLTFFETFTKESFYAELDALTVQSQKLPTLTLTVPVVLDLASREALGVWVRKEVGPEVLLEISTDAGIATGCQIVWGNTLYDFGFDHALHTTKSVVEKNIAERVTAAVT